MLLKGEKATKKAWLVGGGIASLSAAVFMVKDGGIRGENISILEQGEEWGGAMGCDGDTSKGYLVRGGNMLEYEQYQTLLYLLSEIPSAADPAVSVKEEIEDFNKKVRIHAGARLVERNGSITDTSGMGLQEGDRLKLIALVAQTESMLKKSTIEDYFSSHFLSSHFWYMWSSAFGFQPWHSVVEFKRYIQKYMHEFSQSNTMTGMKQTPLNPYDSVILPLTNWLRERDVKFETGCRVDNLLFGKHPESDEQVVKTIQYTRKSKKYTIEVEPEDMVIVTNGSMGEAYSVGSMSKAPKANGKKESASWKLWKKISENRPGLGNPSAFCADPQKTMGELFTVTCEAGNEFLKMMEQFSGNKPGTGAIVTLKDSTWLLSVIVPPQPHFMNQPKETTVFWGYGQYPEKPGDFVQKKMTECSGGEILREVLYQLKMGEYFDEMSATSQCIPCILPYKTAPFMPREENDRPQICPQGYHNLAFASQFAEMPEGIVSSMEYSVKCAMYAVYEFLGLDKKYIPEYYKGDKKMGIIWDSLKTLHK